MKPRRFLSLALLAACATATACGDDDAAENASAPAQRGFIQDRSSSSPAEALFVEKCSMCHRAHGMGTIILARRMPPERAMLESRDDLTADYVRQAVRSGIGNMPRISRGEVSDAQLATIADYLAEGGP
ncbi:MAG: cytochrome c [Sphingomonadaceae bacterium]|nr:cytochrome c [Sphingomonadaceae bacterium]